MSRVSKMLADEYGTASNIKSRSEGVCFAFVSVSNFVPSLQSESAVCAWSNYICATSFKTLH